jgi:hypothetical protein
LTGGNVMLTSCRSRRRGFKAKVADFGLARKLDFESRIKTNIYGTVRARRAAAARYSLCRPLFGKGAP